MGSRSRTSTTSKREVLKKRKADLDRLSTREAQVLRMRHGITEPASASVARPPRGTPPELRKRVQEVEEEILERLRTQEEEVDSKDKIIRSLKKKR